MEIINTIESPLSEVERKITHLEDFVDAHRDDKEIHLQVFFKIDNMVSSIEHQAVESIGFNGLNMDNKRPDYDAYCYISICCRSIKDVLRSYVFDVFTLDNWGLDSVVFETLDDEISAIRCRIFEYRNQSTVAPS